MNPEVRTLIKEGGMCRATVEQVATMLPEDDLVLDRWLEETIAEKDSIGFHVIAFAAFSRNRAVDSRHLATAAKLSGGGYLAVLALHMQGEVPEYVLEGLRGTPLYHITKATAYLAVLAWCDEHRGGVYPEGLNAQARELARHVKDVMEVNAYLLDVARRTKDATLEGIIRDHYPKGSAANWQKVVDGARHISQQAIDWARGPVMAVVPEEPVPLGNSGSTVRRAVPRIGRNDPCHCGSGKKYKHCHYESDRERLQQSSEVAGLTQQELAADAGRHLNMERLDKSSPMEILRIDPATVPRHLMGQFFLRLAMIDLDQAVTSLEKLGWDDDLEDAWFITMFQAARNGRKDVGLRLMAIRHPYGLKEEDLRLSQRLLLARDEPAKWLQLVEESAGRGLKTEDVRELLDLAFAVIHSDYPALGLIVYRGVMPFVPLNEIKESYENIVLPVRERLNLPAADPLKELLENRSVDADMALREAQALFE